MSKKCSSSKIRQFADDTKVDKLGKNSENQLTETVRAIRKGFTINKLTVNNHLCTSINFRNAKTIEEAAFGKSNTANTSCNYLGMFLDSNLKFKDVANYVTEKLNKLYGLKYKIRESYPRKCLLMFYNSYTKTAIAQWFTGICGYDKNDTSAYEKCTTETIQCNHP